MGRLTQHQIYLATLFPLQILPNIICTSSYLYSFNDSTVSNNVVWRWRMGSQRSATPQPSTEDQVSCLFRDANLNEMGKDIRIITVSGTVWIP